MKETIYDYLSKVVFLALSGLVGWVTKNIISLKKKNDATQEGVKALLRDSIIKLYDLYMEKGYMPIYARENLDELYSSYKGLDGNHVVDQLMIELNELPVKDWNKERK